MLTIFLLIMAIHPTLDEVFPPAEGITNHHTYQNYPTITEDHMDNGPWGGVVHAMASGVSDNSRVVAATIFENFALWRSSDGGVTWEWAGVSGTVFYDVCAAPPSTFYAGAFDGLYVSYDNGGNWSKIPGMTSAVTAVGVSQADPNLIFVGIEGFGGVRRSTDGGATWGDVMLNGGWMYDMGIDPEHPDTLYMAMKGLTSPLYRSTDAGVSWSPMGPVIEPGDGGCNLLVAPFGTGETILLSTFNTLFISWDHGATWSEELYPGICGLACSDMVSDGTNLYATYLGDIDDLYPAGVIESTDGGHNWTLNSQGINAYQLSSACLTSQGVLVGHWGGIYLSEGVNDPYQVSQEGLGGFTTTCTAYNNTTGKLFAGGLYSCGFWQSTDHGESWSICSSGLTCWNICDIQPESDLHYQGEVMYAATGEGLFRSDDAGDNWSVTSLTEYVLSVTFDPEDPDRVWAGCAYEVYYSTDGGASWEAGTGFDTYGVFGNNYHVGLVELEGGDLRVLAAGQLFGDVYLSDDAGLSYIKIPFPFSMTWGLSVNWEEDPVVYLATDSGLHISLDRGMTWEYCQSFTGGTACVLGTQEDVYVGYMSSEAWEGLWWSPDLGDTWLTSDNMWAPSVTSISYADAPDQVFVGLEGYGVEKITNDWMGIEGPSPATFSISASPNPFSGFASISASSVDFEAVSIKVFDSAGRLTATLESSDGKASWTPEPGTPDGLYLIHANTSGGDFAVTKVVLLR